MSGGPFRSEVETIRAQLSQVNDEVERLRAERLDLERQIALRARSGAGVVVAIGSVLGVGFLAGSLLVGKHAADEQAHCGARLVAIRDEGRKELEKCEHEQTDVISKYRSCQTSLRATGMSDVGSCVCHPNDTLCACPDGRLLLSGRAIPDRMAVSSNFAALAPAVNRCFAPDAPPPLVVSVTFAPEGTVSSAFVDGWFGATISPLEKDCVERAMRTARIPAFDGAPVPFGRTYPGNFELD